MRLLALYLLLPASVLFAAPLTLRSRLQSGAPMTVETEAKEGVYLVTVVYGGDDIDSATTMKAELRRVYEIGLRVPKGGAVKRTYRVSVHAPEIVGGGKVGLKSREIGTASWDDKLSLEFLGSSARVRSVTVEPDTDKPVVIRLLGDSTMTDATSEPYHGWGQVFPALFDDGVVIDNHAESGLALSSFQGSRRLTKVLSMIGPGDHVFIQFGHNDQKEKGEGVGAFTTYAARLKAYVDAIQAKGGKPVLVTAVARRRFDPQGQVVESLGDFPEAVRRVAKERGLPLIDLNAAAKQVYQALGVERSKLALLHYPANTFPGQTEPLRDDTHFSAYGAYEMARCVAEGIRTGVPELAVHLASAVKPFDPAHPDEPARVVIPASSLVKGDQPEGK